ncbi:hypothetical protein [Nitrosococcus oceani]|uniref:hypothetical protein n=1 Tax=Nitrosococcus oceani TaxID=1229 RepID=UPI0004E926F5|nr:hypothetical protein [Nitrosococcus oceani]KFI22440.1 hypothetical protein HW44_09490 [Nitrosococcus oceani]
MISLKAQAAASGVTLAQLIGDALRESLSRRERVEERGRVQIITEKGTGTYPGIDLDHSPSLNKEFLRFPGLRARHPFRKIL